MNKSGNLSAGELTYWLINEAGFKKSQCRMSIYYKYAPDGTKTVVYLILMILYIGVHPKLLENCFWKI